MGIVVADVLEDAGLAEGKRNAQDEHQGREQVDVQTNVKSLRTVDGGNSEIKLRITQQKQTDPAHPQHPPGHAVRAPFVRHPAAHRAQHATGQAETRGQQRSRADVEAELANVVLHHPERERHVAAKHDAVVLAVLEHRRVLQRFELVAELDMTGNEVRRVAVAEEPEQNHGGQHDGGIDLRYQGPAKGHHQCRCEKFVDRCARVAGAVNAHRKALLAARKPARHIRRADRERATSQTNEETDQQEVPVSRGVAHEPDGRDRGGHQQRHDDAAAVLVGPDAQWHADQRTGQHRHRRQQAEFGGVEAQRFLDRDADHAKHHPDHEAHRKGECADHQHRECLPFFRHVKDSCCPCNDCRQRRFCALSL